MLLFGQDVTGWQSHHRTAMGMARTFQVTSLFPRLTVLDNVLLAIKGLRPSKFVMWRFMSSYTDVYEKAHRLLEQAGFLDRADTEVRYLSHGEQRQLEIVLGLASDPKILLLDEPAAGLSSGESVEMAKFLMKLDPKLAILLIEHDMDVVFDVADADFRAAFRRSSGNRHAGADQEQPEGPGNLPGDRLSHGASSKSRTSTPTTATPTCCRGCRCSSSRARFSACSGRNGVGKTTLVNSIVGFTPPRRGRIVFKGDDITRNSSFETVRSGMGLVPQGRRVFPTLSVEENLLVAERSTERHGWNLERVYDTVSAAARAPQPARQDAVRRRAADARDRPRADDQSGLPDHGRAVGRAGAHHHPGRVGGDRQAQEARACPSCWSSRTPRWRSSWSTTSTS